MSNGYTETAGDSLCGTRAEPASFRSAELCQDVWMEQSAVRLHCLKEHIAGKSLRKCHEDRDNSVMRNFTVWALYVRLYKQGGWHRRGVRLAWQKIRFVHNFWVGRDSSATGWTVRRSHLVGGGDIPHLSRPAVGLTQPPLQCVPGRFTRGKAARPCLWPPNPT